MIEFPYLVQRVVARDHPAHKILAKDKLTSRKGVDQYFNFDYMGSSEFEFGALPDALKKMRAAEILPEPKCIKIEDYIIWFVGPESHYQLAFNFFDDQLREDVNQKAHLKEITQITVAYDINEHWERDHFFNIIGWWAIEQAWILFMKKDHAELWLKGLHAN